MRIGAPVLALGLLCGAVASGQQVRKSIFALDPNGPEVTSLRKGVQVMQGRTDPTDPTSWAFQANIHGTSVSNPLAAWNQCQHRSFYFFSWHRMYLYYFERILRAAAGDPSLTLPYWNYTDDPHVQNPNQLPLAFRQPQDASNPLYFSNRAGPMNDGSGFLPAADVNTSIALALIPFEGPNPIAFGGGAEPQPAQFGLLEGALENTPHDQVHVDVGGCMADVLCSANDPIFFLHHANIDRLWNRWIALGGGRQDPTTDTVWMTTVFTFYDENKHQVQLTGKDILDTVKQLNYCYDDDPNCGCLKIPELYNLTLPLAEQALTAAGFTVGNILHLGPVPQNPPKGATLGPGVVVKQEPLPGLCAQPGPVSFTLQPHWEIHPH
jgi:Common central domain of tyrosinase/Polyphenol oxidase middle domain